MANFLSSRQVPGWNCRQFGDDERRCWLDEGEMDVTGEDLGEWRDTGTNQGFAAGLSGGDSAPCRDDTTLDDHLRRRGLGLGRGENDTRSIVLLEAEDTGLGGEEGLQERPA
jgi:hypothetical protein